MHHMGDHPLRAILQAMPPALVRDIARVLKVRVPGYRLQRAPVAEVIARLIDEAAASELAERYIRLRWQAEGRTIAAAPVLPTPDERTSPLLVLKFSYRGPHGQLDLRRGLHLVVPAPTVRRLGLVEGDLVAVSFTGRGEAHLTVHQRVPRGRWTGRVARPGSEAWRSCLEHPGAWPVIDAQGAVVGYVSDDEARHRGLADRDEVTVVGPAGVQGLVRVLQGLENE